jgi:TM2 domain-containing membrane protein YozV
MEELIEGGVVVHETYIWCTGMPQWLPADNVVELKAKFASAPAMMAPPPPPSMQGSAPPVMKPQASTAYQPYGSPTSYQGSYPLNTAMGNYPAIQSDKSRVAGGILNIVLPGVGRMYMGYAAIGVIQLFVTICTGGVGVLWPLIDGVLILSGSVKYDGYGRTLKD